MKKLNNKGFAISTVIYGLAIMGILIVALLMATMSTTRSNSSEMAKEIESDLNRFSKTETNFGYMLASSSSVPIAQKYIVPDGASGYYRIELWGTQGGGANGGFGAYTSGVIKLMEGDVLYFYVGKHMSDSNGGKETDVRIISGGYTDSKSYNTRIMVAAGGGSGARAAGGTLVGYQASMVSQGGAINVNNGTKDYGLLPTGTGNNTNGTLIGYPTNYQLSSVGQTGVSSPAGSSGGGDGYYPSNNANVGGVSFVSGYGGSKAIIKGAVSNQPTYQYYEQLYNDETETYYYTGEAIPYRFVDGHMIAGVNQGDGKARIERLVSITDEVQTLIRKNHKLDSVRYIRDCLTGGANTTFAAIQSDTGVDLAIGKTPSASGNCKVLDLGAAYKLDEVAVWHPGLHSTSNGSGLDVQNHTIEVSDGGGYQFIKAAGSGTVLSETETAAGFHISAFQYDSTTTLPDTGNYYIMPVLSETKVMTANETADLDANPIKIEPLLGMKRQKWSIEKITNPDVSTTGDEYKIVELARYKALSIYQDENMVKNNIAANAAFNDLARNEPQIWKIRAVGNGTYVISTVVAVFDDANVTGNILPQTNQTVTDDLNNIIIGKNNVVTQRFKLIAVDYSGA